MKIVINLTIWACLAFFSTVNAQENPSTLKDTLIIQIEGNSQLHIIGSSLKELAKYDRADSLKSLFVTDYNKALQNGQITNSTHRIHYLISKEGQRRMKAACDAYTEEPFDLDAEKKRFQFNLPKIHYTIYDLAKNVEMHFYMADSSTINKLGNFHIGEAQKMLSSQKKDLRRSYKLGLERDGLGFKINGKEGKQRVELSTNAVIGAMLFGDRLSPLLGMDFGLALSNKYRKPVVKLGFEYSTVAIYPVNNIPQGNVIYDFSISANNPKAKGVNWTGIQYGIIQGLQPFGFYKNTPKFGFHTSTNNGSLIYSFDFVGMPASANDQEEIIMMFTFKKVL